MYKILVVLVFSYFGGLSCVVADEVNMSAVVGGEVITNYDVEQRIKIISLTSGMVFNQNTIGTIRNRVRELLIIEKIQFLESIKYNLLVHDDEVDRVFESIAQDNKMSKSGFKKFLVNRGIDVVSFKDQIRNSLNWQNVILYKIRPLISISDYEMASYFELLEDGTDGYEYLVDIVMFSISDSDDTKKLVKKIYDKVQKGELSFSAVMEDLGKNVGGQEKKIWKYRKDFVVEIQDILADLEIGEVSQPIEIGDMYHMVNLVNKRPALLKVTDKNYKEKVYKKLFVQKLEKKIHSYLQTLKQNSFIERKAL